VDEARTLARHGRPDAALDRYRQALRQQPANWVLLNEVALFLTFALQDARAGLDLARLALDLNPLSAGLWTTAGECLYAWGGSRDDEALHAYQQAAQRNPSDVRPHLGLAWVHARKQDHAAALRQLAEGLARDGSGQFREQLLQKQAEVLARLSQRHQQEQLRLANRVRTAGPSATPASASAPPPDKPAAKAEDGTGPPPATSLGGRLPWT